MRKLRITLAQINTTVGDLCGNVDKALDAVREAESLGSDLVIFPELTVSGYPPEDLLLKPGFIKGNRSALERFVENVGDITAVIGFVDGSGPIYNAAAVVNRGEIRCTHHKMNLPNYGVFDEKRYFAEGETPQSFMLGDIAVGLNICEDTWVGDCPYCSLYSDHHVDLLLNLSASPFHTGKVHERAEMLRRRSLEGNTCIAYTNLVGGQDELVFDGGSMIYNRRGDCLVNGPLFSDAMITHDIVFDGDSPKSVPESARITLAETSKAPLKPLQSSEMSADEEILEALVLGTRDYIRKNGFSRVVIGLSGGIDSTLVAAVAVQALGKENVVGVTMPSKYTSDGTRSDAEILANNLGIEFHEIPVSTAFDAFKDSLSGLFAGRDEDVTEENLQARVRGMLLMALSNKFGWLVLTTGNKSEMATGYATLYGDMAGGFASIKDVPKLTVFRLCWLFNEQAGSEIIPESVITRPPSAELRPDQKDSDSLPEYDILDPILKAYIEDDMGVDNIVALGFDRDTVKRIVRLCDLTEYKRRQAPPGVKITPRAFGRDRRLPITNRFRP